MTQDAFSRRSEPEYAPEYEDDNQWDDGEISITEPDDPLAFADPDLIKLGLTLDFGPGDLAANQEGVLSPAQIARLELDLRWFYWPMLAVLGVFALVGSILSIITGSWGALLLVLFLFGMSSVTPTLLYKRELIRLPYRSVHYTTMRMGGFALTMRRWGLSDSENMPVEGGKTVFGPKHLYKVLRANRTYLAYYVPLRTWKGYRLLSLEPLDEGGEKPKRKAKPKR